MSDKEESEQIIDVSGESPSEESLGEQPADKHSVDKQTEAEHETDDAKEKDKRSSFGFWTFIILLALLIASVFVYVPKETREVYLDRAIAFISDKMVKEPAPATEKSETTTEPVISSDPAPESEPKLEPKPTPVAPVIVTTGASSEEIERLLSAMEGLRGEIHSLQQQQRELQESQAEMQRMQLRTRLHWITNQTNHLPQLQLAWEEIALMPTLTADERSRAEQMHALAKERTEQLIQWQQSLVDHADQLTLKEQANIVPAFENRWLNWVAEQFSIRPSLNQQERQDAELRRQLIDTSRNLELERWPDTKQWLQLRARLQLRVASMAPATDGAESIQLDLPESFDAMIDDIKLLRNTASQWLEAM